MLNRNNNFYCFISTSVQPDIWNTGPSIILWIMNPSGLRIVEKIYSDSCWKRLFLFLTPMLKNIYNSLELCSEMHDTVGEIHYFTPTQHKYHKQKVTTTIELPRRQLFSLSIRYYDGCINSFIKTICLTFSSCVFAWYDQYLNHTLDYGYVFIYFFNLSQGDFLLLSECDSLRERD